MPVANKDISPELHCCFSTDELRYGGNGCEPGATVSLADSRFHIASPSAAPILSQPIKWRGGWPDFYRRIDETLTEPANP
jgi:hypothetical protein